MLFKQQPAERRRQHQSQIASEIAEAVGALTVVRCREIRHQRVIARPFERGENAAHAEHDDRRHADLHQRTRDVARDRHQIAHNDELSFVEAVGKLSAQQRKRELHHTHDQAEHGRLCRRHPDLDRQDERQHRPYERAHIRHDPPVEQNVHFAPQAPVHVKKLQVFHAFTLLSG